MSRPIIDTHTLKRIVEILKRKSTIPLEGETFEEISNYYDYAVEVLENLLPDEESQKQKQYNENGTLKTYKTDSVCGECGENQFYLEKVSKVNIVCNSCNTVFAEYKEEFLESVLQDGVWK